MTGGQTRVTRGQRPDLQKPVAREARRTPAARYAATMWNPPRRAAHVLRNTRPDRLPLRALLAATAALALPVLADDPCAADAARLCAGTRGEGRLLQCLRDQESFVSQSCQQAINRVRLTRMKIQASCAGDVGKFCRDVPEGAGRILSCLLRHEKELASDCREVVAKLR